MQFAKQVARLVLIDVVWNIIYFPVWWYTKGVEHISLTIFQQAKDLIRTLNLHLLAKFLFKPMYGLTDIWSRIISFPVRLVHFSILGIMAIMYILALMLLLILWVMFPVFVIINIGYQLNLILLWN